LIPAVYDKILWKDKILIIKFLKPTLLANAIIKMTSEFLKIQNIQPSSMSLDKIVKANDNNDPVLLITSTGSDPSKEIEE